MSSKLSPEDQSRVDKYLSSTIHQVERKPYQLRNLLLTILGMAVILAGAAFLVGLWYNSTL